MRAYGSVGGTPRFLASASGPYVTDAAGRTYVDLVASWGPALLGHAHPEVVEAVREAASRGLSFGAPTGAEVELADLIAGRVVAPDAPVPHPIERVRLVSTGTEATMTAIRLARGFTGRDLLVKFSGHYHGHSDGLLAEAGSGVATLALPGSAGVPAPIAAQTLVIPYNDLAAVDEVFAVHGDRIAAVIVEAAAANMGVVPPLPGFNAALAERAHAHGALLIIDEVLTGLPRAPGRVLGAAGLAGRALHARHLHVRQGRRRRDAARGPGRARRCHGAARPDRPGLPGRHPVGQPALGRRRDSRRSGSRPPRSTRGWMPRPTPSRPCSRRP